MRVAFAVEDLEGIIVDDLAVGVDADLFGVEEGWCWVGLDLLCISLLRGCSLSDRAVRAMKKGRNRDMIDLRTRLRYSSYVVIGRLSG